MVIDFYLPVIQKEVSISAYVYKFYLNLAPTSKSVIFSVSYFFIIVEWFHWTII